MADPLVAALRFKMSVDSTSLTYRSETMHQFVPIAEVEDAVGFVTFSLSTTVDSSRRDVAVDMSARNWVVMTAQQSPHGTPHTRISVCNHSSVTLAMPPEDAAYAGPQLLHPMADLLEHHVGTTTSMALQHMELVLISDLMTDDA